MKTADLYIRVSTDEQADKGYSQRSQEEMLRKYCAINTISVGRVIYEDHSAKTFNRPEWTKLLMALRKYKKSPDLILFTKWDRFSRNAGDAYQMISLLRKLGAEPQAIEQPLDLTVPENKMMLAFYLAAPEVENDRRALNTFFGMRRAKKEGRWMAGAPVGYINKSNENGRKYISIDETLAPVIKWIFNELATTNFIAEQVWKKARSKGFKSGKNAFWLMLRNPVYCGKILIPKYKDEEAQFVQGLHEPIISERLFYEVQDVLDGNKKKQRTKIYIDENLPLRGFLVCPKCGIMLTGSASKGASKYYHYYHCNSSCGCRYRADNTNNLFIKELTRITPRRGTAELYKVVIQNLYKKWNIELNRENKEIIVKCEELNNMISTARRKLIKEEIDAIDFKIIKNDCEKEIRYLESKLTSLSMKSEPGDTIIEQVMDRVSRLDILYQNGSVYQKRVIVSSIYPGNLVFDGVEHRTFRMNEVIQLLCSVDTHFKEIQKEIDYDFSQTSLKVSPQGLEPWTR